ncbi:MAG: hypothetical protein Q8M94_08325 [Ignavibacteria bacterium]|nr:hypothetical protein [Ignavibacteria bacterium]
MELALIVQLIPIVLTVVQSLKRFIPDKQRTVVNPVLAVVTGLVGAYYAGGQAEVLNILLTGVLAGAGAIGAYKVPKIAGKALGIV